LNPIFSYFYPLARSIKKYFLYAMAFFAVLVALAWGAVRLIRATTATAAGAADSYVARHRTPWWRVRLRTPPPILASYMGRRPPVFVRNHAAASYLNIAHGLYPREPLAAGLLDALAVFLNGSVTAGQGRVYAGGLVNIRDVIMPPAPGVYAAVYNYYYTTDQLNNANGDKISFLDAADDHPYEVPTYGVAGWSKDGKYIYFDNFFTDHPTARRIKLGDPRSEELFSLAGLRQYQGTTSGTWSGLAPDGSKLYVQDLSAQEIYALDVDYP